MIEFPTCLIVSLEERPCYRTVNAKKGLLYAFYSKERRYNSVANLF